MMRWHILTTEPQRETAAGAGLIGRRFNVYVPFRLEERRINRDGNRLWAEELVPLIPGYLFVRLDPEAGHWNRVRDIPGVRNFLDLDGHKATLSDEAMRLLQGIEVRECTPKRKGARIWPFKAGDEVSVGPGGGIHEGLTGIVERIDKSDRAVLNVVLPSRVWTILTSAAWLQKAS